MTLDELRVLFCFIHEFFDDELFDKFVDFFWSNYYEN